MKKFFRSIGEINFIYYIAADKYSYVFITKFEIGLN